MAGGIGGFSGPRFETVANPGFDPNRTFRTSSGRMATVNPRQRVGVVPTARLGSSQHRGGGGGRGGVAAGSYTTGSMYGTGGGGGGGGGGGWPPAPTGKTTIAPEVKLEATPSPELQEATKRWEEHMAHLREQAAKVDENLQFQIEQYKSRLGEGPTTRAIERSASAIRDQLAGLTAGAESQAAAMGRGQGFGQAGLSETAQRAQAGAAADIALGRERDLDALTIAGQNIMAAPGQQAMGYNQMASQFYGLAPYAQQAAHMLGTQRLGLDAYMGRGQLALGELDAYSRRYGTPRDWMSWF